MNRRAFLTGFSLVAGGVVLQLAGCGAKPIEVTQALPPEAAVIGKAYLRVRGDEAGSLGELIFADARWAPVSERTGAAVQKLLAEQIRDDFRAGRVVEVDGWFLSETEGRLCALIA